MKDRLIVAAIGIPILLAILLLAPPWATTAMVCALSAVGCYELIMAVKGERKRLFIVLPLISAFETFVFSEYPEDVAVLGALALLVIVYSFAIAIFCWSTDRKVNFAQTMAGIFGALGMSAAFSSISLLRGVSALLALTPLVAAFSSDAGAYFAGRAFGRHKLAPAVSPNKTVEGCVGGFAGAIVGMSAFHLIARAAVGLDIGWDMVIGMGILGSFMGQLGDLSFSVVKREFGIKDYGKVFASHGGVLDRFDSVLFVAPAFWLLLRLVFI